MISVSIFIKCNHRCLFFLQQYRTILKISSHPLTVGQTDNTINTDSTDVRKGDAMFLLNLQGKEPIFEQIQSQVLRFIEAGVLKEGDRLPSVRQLARDNGINPNTVARAYSQLEENGIVVNIPKKGVYVATIDTKSSRHKEIVTVITALKENGVTKEEILEVTDMVFREA